MNHFFIKYDNVDYRYMIKDYNQDKPKIFH